MLLILPKWQVLFVVMLINRCSRSAGAADIKKGPECVASTFRSLGWIIFSFLRGWNISFTVKSKNVPFELSDDTDQFL